MTEDELVKAITKMRPRPDTFVAVYPGGKEQPILSNRGRNRWRRIAITALDAMKSGARIEARKENALLRAWDPDVDVVDDDDDDGAKLTRREREQPLEPEQAATLRYIANIEDAAIERSTRVIRPVMDMLLQTMKQQDARLELLMKQQSAMLRSMVDSQVARGEAEVALLEADATRARLEAEIAERRAGEPDPTQAAAADFIQKFTGIKLPPSAIPNPNATD